MPPKKGKKGAEEEPPPQPADLLPEGYSVGCQVYWISYPQTLDDGALVRPGSPGVLESVPDVTVSENEEGEKVYSLEAVLVLFDCHPEPQTVPIKDKVIDVRPPPVAAIWNLEPAAERRRVQVPALFEPLAPAAARKETLRERSASPPKTASTKSASTGFGVKAMRSTTTSRSMTSMTNELVEKSRSSSPFVDAMYTLEAHPCRTDKVKGALSPELAAFLDDTEFQYSCTSLGGHAAPGRNDWRAIYPWVVDVVKTANAQACLEPQLSIDHESYASIVKRFDKSLGAWMCNVPLSENVLPFAKFVVVVLYLEAQEEDRKRAEKEEQILELLEEQCSEQEGDPRIALLWDTDDVLDLQVIMPDGMGVINSRERSVDCDDDPDAEFLSGTGLAQPLESISWPLFDPEATGPDAASCPPPGEYRVRVVRAERRSQKPCHWACCVLAEGEVSTFGGTWDDQDTREITTFFCSEIDL